MRKAKVLLVYPEIPATYWSFRYAMPLIGKRAMMPPLGLLTVAALLPPERFEARLVDLNVERLRDADIEAADLVMASAMLVQKGSLRELSARCRRLGRPLAAGGPYPTACPEDLEGVEHLVLGEGEASLPPFLDDWLSGRPKPRYEGAGRPPLDSTPIPAFGLARLGRYSLMALQFSRGCPHGCEFCDIAGLFGRAPRAKSPGRFLAELEALAKAGARGRAFVVDDNFIGSKGAARELLRALVPWQAERGYPFSFTTEASLDLARDGELLDLMAAANFRSVFIGLESPDEASLASAGKAQNLAAEPREAVRLIQRKGIEVAGGFIVGFDADRPGVFERQEAFIRELAVPNAMVGLLMALPGTPLRERLAREGRLIEESSGNNTHAVSLNFRPAMPRGLLLDGYFGVLGKVFAPRAYFDRCLALLARYPPERGRPKPGERGPVDAEGVLCLARSFLSQAFSSYGLEYLRYLRKALSISPRLIGDIVALAIQGRHLIELTRRSLRERRRASAAPPLHARGLSGSIGA